MENGNRDLLDEAWEQHKKVYPKTANNAVGVWFHDGFDKACKIKDKEISNLKNEMQCHIKVGVEYSKLIDKRDAEITELKKQLGMLPKDEIKLPTREQIDRQVLGTFLCNCGKCRICEGRDNSYMTKQFDMKKK